MNVQDILQLLKPAVLVNPVDKDKAIPQGNYEKVAAFDRLMTPDGDTAIFNLVIPLSPAMYVLAEAKDDGSLKLTAYKRKE